MGARVYHPGGSEFRPLHVSPSDPGVSGLAKGRAGICVYIYIFTCLDIYLYITISSILLLLSSRKSQVLPVPHPAWPLYRHTRLPHDVSPSAFVTFRAVYGFGLVVGI